MASHETLCLNYIFAACRVWLCGLWSERRMKFIVQRKPIECFWIDVNTVILKYHVSFSGKSFLENKEISSEKLWETFYVDSLKVAEVYLG